MTLNKHVDAMRTLVDDPDLVASNRKRLVEVATKLFRTKGYHKTSTRDIALAADMSVGALYQYIHQKEDLLVLILQSFSEIHEKSVLPLSKASGSARERLHRAISVYYKTFEEHHAKTNVVYHEFSNLRNQTKNYFSEMEDQVSATIREILDQGIEEGQFRATNTHFLAHNIVSMAHMWALKRRRFRNIMTIDDYIAEQIKYLDAILTPKTP